MSDCIYIYVCITALKCLSRIRFRRYHDNNVPDMYHYYAVMGSSTAQQGLVEAIYRQRISRFTVKCVLINSQKNTLLTPLVD